MVIILIHRMSWTFSDNQTKKRIFSINLPKVKKYTILINNDAVPELIATNMFIPRLVLIITPKMLSRMTRAIPNSITLISVNKDEIKKIIRNSKLNIK